MRGALSASTVLAFGATVAFLAVVALASAVGEHDLAFFTREPVTALQSATCDGPACSYVGIVSNVGVLVWTAGAVAALLAAVAADVVPRVRRMLLCAAGLTAVLLLDDMLLLHEYVWREVSFRGETGVFAVYALLMAGFGLTFRRELAALRHAPLAAAALALFALSLTADRYAVGGHLLEDGAKLLATVSWTCFLVGTAVDVLRRRQNVHQYG